MTRSAARETSCHGSAILPESLYQPHPMKLSFSTQLNGCLNSERISVTGKGWIDENVGLTEGIYQLNALPRGFPAKIIPVLKVTGYPNASRAIGSAVNVFKGGSYSYVRHLDFPGGHMELRSNVCVDGAHLHSDFTVEGNFVPPGEIGDIAPLKESWLHRPDGTVEGLFEAAWPVETGGRLTAKATTLYTVRSLRPCPERQHRAISLQTVIRGRELHLRQSVDLFGRACGE